MLLTRRYLDEMRRESKGRLDEMRRESREHIEEMRRDSREHLEEMRRESEGHLDELRRESKGHLDELRRESKGHLDELRRESREYHEKEMETLEREAALSRESHANNRAVLAEVLAELKETTEENRVRHEAMTGALIDLAAEIRGWSNPSSN